MGRYGDLNYPRLTKHGFLFGASLFVLGSAGEIIGRALVGALPNWENTLFITLIGLGIAIGLASVFVFGVALPLTE